MCYEVLRDELHITSAHPAYEFTLNIMLNWLLVHCDSVVNGGCFHIISLCVYRGAPINWHIFGRLITLSHIDQFPNFFTFRIRRKSVIVPSLKNPPHLKCVATLPCEMSCLNSNNWKQDDFCDDTHLGVRCPAARRTHWTYCRMWQLRVLWIITETINTLFPVVNFLKCVVTEVLSSVVALRCWHFTR